METTTRLYQTRGSYRRWGATAPQRSRDENHLMNETRLLPPTLTVQINAEATFHNAAVNVSESGAVGLAIRLPR